MSNGLINFDFDSNSKKIPSNIFALRIIDSRKNMYNIAINHCTYCPNIETERDQSRFNDYLSNLEYKVVDEFYKANKIKKPKYYSVIFEILTNNEGKIFHYSESLNN